MFEPRLRNPIEVPSTSRGRTILRRTVSNTCWRKCQDSTGTKSKTSYQGARFHTGHRVEIIARISAMLAGLPSSVAGTTVNRFCASGLQAVAIGAHQIMNEGVDAIIAGGVESISMIKPDTDPHPELQKRLPGLYMSMGDTAEVVAKRYKISRRDQDAYSLLSQQRTARAQSEGFFKGEIAPINVTMAVLDKKTGEKVGVRDVFADRDECNRPDTTLESLQALKPYFDPDSGQGTVTAGNASQLSDGASATLLMSRERCEQFRDPLQTRVSRLSNLGVRPGRNGDRTGFCRSQAFAALRIDDPRG